MNRDTWDEGFEPLRGFYRNRENGWVSGVCAGIADYFNFRTGTVRLIAVVCLLFFTWITVAVYLGMTFLIRERPLVYSGRRSEYEFWRAYRNDQWRRS